MAYPRGREIGHVDGGEVHGDSPHDGAPSAADQHDAAFDSARMSPSPYPTAIVAIRPGRACENFRRT